MLAACGVKQVSKRQAREKVPRGCYCRLFAFASNVGDGGVSPPPLPRCRSTRVLLCSLNSSIGGHKPVVHWLAWRRRGNASAAEVRQYPRSGFAAPCRRGGVVPAHSRLHVTLLFSYSACFSWLRFPCRTQFELRLLVSNSDCCCCCHLTCCYY